MLSTNEKEMEQGLGGNKTRDRDMATGNLLPPEKSPASTQHFISECNGHQ